MLNKRLAELLVKEELLNQDDVEEVMKAAESEQKRVIDILIERGLTDEAALIQFFSKQYRLPVVDLSNFDMDDRMVDLVPRALCLKHKIVPIGKRGETLVIAVSDPSNIQALDDIKFQTRMKLEQSLALPSSINMIMERSFGVDIDRLSEELGAKNESAGELLLDENQEQQEGSEDDAPIIQFVSGVLTDAIRRKASDIHIEPYDKELRVRLRIDGDLFNSLRPPNNLKNAITARIKVMSKMRLDERRLPQDGRIRFRLNNGRVVDFRVNTLPTVYGEKVVLRILDKSAAVMNLEDLGFETDDLQKFMTAVENPWGMVLVTGATGSGKTTSLYAAMNKLNDPSVNISTVEDPVEYNFKGMNQCQMKETIGFTFANALRALLRQDPDVILVGEIRDYETAEVAMKAALTGHMVLSTVHTNDAPSTIMRLKDMGIEPFTINSALRAVLAQRLVRKVCTKCAVPDERATPELLKKMGFPESAIGKIVVKRGQGCRHCRNTGNRGRMAIHEILVMNEKVREIIGQGASTDEIRAMAIKYGMRPMRTNCMRKVARGLVALEDLEDLGIW